MKQYVVLALLVVVLAGCQYLRPALGTADCAAGIVQPASVATGAATGAATAEAPETSRSGVPVKTVTEGELVSFPNLKAVDPDGDKLSYTFSSPLNSKGEWQTKTGDAGEYKTIITVSDGKTQSTQDVIVRVLSANKAPTIEIESTIIAKEGEQFVLAPKVSDLDGDEVTTVYTGWMTTNTKNVGFDSAGTHEVNIIVDDGKGGKTTKTVKVAVENTNRQPVILQIMDIAAKEGDRVEILPKVLDSDGDEVTLTFSAPFDENGVWQTAKGDEGIRKVTITADDKNGGSSSISLIVAVESTNSAPTIVGPDTVTVDEGTTIDLSESYTIADADNDKITVSVSGWMTALTKSLGYDDAGTHEVTITASDGINEPASKKITVVVNDLNRPPVFDRSAFG